VLAVCSPDPLLSALASLGLAASAGSGLVVDLDGGLAHASRRSLADMVAEGPRLDELSPGRAGVAVIPGGPIGVSEAGDYIQRLSRHWPAIVLRVPDTGHLPVRTVPVIPLLEGIFQLTAPGSAVWQPMEGGVDPPGPGPVLPRLPVRTTRLLLAGRLPGRSRWIRAWRPIWELPWA
jgi:hypothetical protein